MPKSRKSQISLADTAYYHCVSRCVRRAFLCGEDKYTGISYEHRRQWVEDRLHLLTEVFAIDVCAYAVMSNHTHVVLHVNPDKASHWTTDEVIQRWHRLHRGTLLSIQYADTSLRQTMPESLKLTVEETAEVWRQRLCDISWFMRSLNEYIARAANKEDDCTGRFWEGRFKSQALLDEAALTACMAYVDLNPVRAGMAETPETSDHTSIQYRINAEKAGKSPKRLMPFAGNPQSHMPSGLPFVFRDYLQLVDITGRQIARGKQGIIDGTLPDILTRLNLNAEQWGALTLSFESCFYSVAGGEDSLIQYQQRKGMKHIKGRSQAKRLLNPA